RLSLWQREDPPWTALRLLPRAWGGSVARSASRRRSRARLGRCALALLRGHLLGASGVVGLPSQGGIRYPKCFVLARGSDVDRGGHPLAQLPVRIRRIDDCRVRDHVLDGIGRVPHVADLSGERLTGV